MQYPQTLITEMKIRNFSPRTMKAYLYHNDAFLEFAKKPPLEVTQKDIESYLLHLADKGLLGSTRHLIVAALAFYYTGIMKRKFAWKYPRTAKPLPRALSKDEVTGIIDSISNPKHKLIIELMYSAGLRVSEAINLKWEDIDFDRNIIHIKDLLGHSDIKTTMIYARVSASDLAKIKSPID